MVVTKCGHHFLLLETKYIVYMNTDLCYNNDSYKSALINELY